MENVAHSPRSAPLRPALARCDSVSGVEEPPAHAHALDGLDPARVTLVVEGDTGSKAPLPAPTSKLEAFWIRTSVASVERGASNKPLLSDAQHAALAAWRARGGRTTIVLPGPIPDSAQYPLCDTVMSDAPAAPHRAHWLAERFGDEGYVILGKDGALLPRSAMQGHEGNEQGNQSKASANADTAEVSGRKPAMPPLLRLLRPHQWLKNLLIFAPMLAAHDLSSGTIIATTLAFAAFCLAASATYVLNDLLDITADRQHPRKRFRPLASGAVSLGQATIIAPLLALSSLGLALLVSAPLAVLILLYCVMTTLYSLKLKRLAIIDICTLSVLYTLRILAGSAASGLPISEWLLAFSVFFFFSLACLKRKAELVDGANAGGKSLYGRGYQAGDLATISHMVTASGMVSVLVLALYTNSEPVRELYDRPEWLWGICLVLLYWNSRMALITQRGDMHDDPLVFAACDRGSQICFGLIIALALAATLL